MKRALCVGLIGLLLLTGCNTGDSGGVRLPAAAVDMDLATDENRTHGTLTSRLDGDLIEIDERLFIAQTNDIYLNMQDYFGRTIKYEGLFKTINWPETDETFLFVLRYGPGCCGYDGTAGFEVAWDGPWPEEDDWTEAVGTLEVYEDNGFAYLRLRLSSLTVLEERGAEYVFM